MIVIKILYLIALIGIIIYEFHRKKNKAIDILTLVNVWFGFNYLFVPFLTIDNSYYLPNYFKVLVEISPFIHLNAFLIIMIFYFFVNVFFTLGLRMKRNYYFKSTGSNKWKTSAVILLFISIFGLLGFLSGYGGLTNVVKNINTIRSGVYERNTIAAIARMFTVYSSIALLFLISIYKKNLHVKNKFSIIILILISSMLTLFNVFLSGGRAGMLFPIIQVLIIITLIDNKIHFKKILLIFPLVIFIGIYGKIIVSSIGLGMEHVISIILRDSMHYKSILKSFLDNFTHPYYSLITSVVELGNTEMPIFFLNPYYTLKFFMNLFGLPYHGTISHINSELILGIYDSNIPPGIIALGYYNLFLPGVIITASIFGYILSLIEWFYKHLLDNTMGLVLYSVTIDMVSQFVFNGDIRVFFMQRFSVLILIGVYTLRNTKLCRRLQ